MCQLKVRYDMTRLPAGIYLDGQPIGAEWVDYEVLFDGTPKLTLHFPKPRWMLSFYVDDLGERVPLPGGKEWVIEIPPWVKKRMQYTSESDPG